MRPVSRLSLVTLTVSLLAVLHAPAGIAAGQTLYVKVSGSDSAACTAADPCRTIKHAVSVAEPGDTIQLGPGTFSEDNGVTIDKNLTITGGWYAGFRVSLGWYDSLAAGCCSVFTIGSGAKVTLTGMAISGGNGPDGEGIHNAGILTLKNVLIWDNHKKGILNDGSLVMTNVEIHHNYGAGLSNSGTAIVVDSQITGTYGSTSAGDHVADGIDNIGTLAVNRGLIAGNQGRGVAALAPFGGASCPTTVLTNVTISGNSHGGVQALCGTMTLTHVTVAGNTSKEMAGGLQAQGNPLYGDSVAFRNSIVATNSGPQCQGSVSASYSLLGDSSCLVWPTPDNLIGVDPKLSGLSYPAGLDLVSKVFHLGATRVRALLPGSPAIDSAGDAYCTPTDQLGVARPLDGDGDGVARCDMGAYEYQPPGGGGTR